MMKRVFSIAALMLLCLIATGCPEKPEEPLDITGEWQLSQIVTKASIGTEQVDVFIAFTSAGSFDIYQMLGTGRYRHYTGSWTLTDKTLTGTYTGGTAWASTYTVEMDADKTSLTLTSQNEEEVQTYTKKPIPDDVRSNAIDK